MTFEQAFQKVKSKFDKVDTSKLTSDFAIQVSMTDSDCGGIFYIQSAGGELRVEPYDYRDNTANVALKKLDLYKILDGKLSVAQAAESGKAVIYGNAADLEAAAACIVHDEPAPKAEKKPAVKAPKATAKKAAAKSSAKKETIKKAEPKKEAAPAKAESTIKASAKAEAKAASTPETAKPSARKTSKK